MIISDNEVGGPPMVFSVMSSPIGELLLTSQGEKVRGLYMLDGPASDRIGPSWERRADAPILKETARQLVAYFRRDLREFDLPIEFVGTPFQKKVWSALIAIPYGVTTTYGEVARRVGDPQASRAVGLANGKNPIAIIIPCHRVVGANGKLVGYGGGLERKRRLLNLEASSQSTGALPL